MARAIMCFWIFVGSGCGGIARYLLGGLIATTVGETFSWDTLLINITGSFLIGFFATITGPDGRLLVSPVIRQFVIIGFCGGYTTFSSFSLQTLNLAHDGDFLHAGANIVFSVAFCLLAVWLGFIAATACN